MADGALSSTCAHRTSDARTASSLDRCTSLARCSNGESIPTRGTRTRASRLSTTGSFLFCAEGFSSSFAATSLRELGCTNATDIVGGFDAWKSDGLPVREFADSDESEPQGLPGMGLPAQP